MAPTNLLKIGVVGATGMVGSEFMKILKQRRFPIKELRAFASEESAGKRIHFRDETVELQVLKDGCFEGLDLVFFSSGDEISEEWAPKAVKEGAFAVDNSGAFRMHPEIALVVPEVNGHLLDNAKMPTIIANPNCSTIQMVAALQPIREKFGISAIKVSTYQSVSGAGKAAVDELKQQTLARLNHQDVETKVFPHSIAFNNLPQIGSFDGTGFTSEEQKMRRETKKIFGDEDIKVSAFCVRTSTLNGHSEAVWVTTKNKATREEIVSALKTAPGVQIQDNASNSEYPLTTKASGEDPVFVGRIHQDPDDEKTWMMWIVSDNIRKGAALNGIQIAERIYGI